MLAFHSLFHSIILFLFIPLVIAIGQNTSIAFVASSNTIRLASSRIPVAIIVDPGEWPAVLNAAENLGSDFGLVTGRNATLYLTGKRYTKRNITTKNTSSIWNPKKWTSLNGMTLGGDVGVILAGTRGASSLIDGLIQQQQLDAQSIDGGWETFISNLVDDPIAGISRALVIAGSDRRGTVYGLYDISEQIGVSPWYWFADIPPKRHEAIYGLNITKTQGPPTVRYRGFFINDEAPALTGWTNAKFPRSKYGSAFTSEFYIRVFELLLRLRANYLWPAMWGSMFGLDDLKNQELAHEYGIVMGTSHTEPLMRATREQAQFVKGPWQWDVNNNSMREFMLEGAKRAKPYESLFTMGIRGNHDTGINGGSAVKQLEGVFKAQREILNDVYGDQSKVPQMWSLYKEVQSYYDDDGLKVPDDITLLWSDDNWGNLQRMPLASERNRSGGAGVYYHFDYVGDPRNYKWINTIQLQRTWEQMRFALERNATRIWVVNVGDIKGLELPINHWFDMAYDMSSFIGPESTAAWTNAWATREFGPMVAQSIENVVSSYSFLVGRRKYELLDASTYSVINYEEGDKILAEWHNLSVAAQKIYDALPEESRAAFFEIVLHPVLAGATVHEIHIGSAKNNLYVMQGRNSANSMADHVMQKWKLDHGLTERYHKLLGGKWEHIMDQTHFYNDYWQQPSRNIGPQIQYLQPLEGGLSGEMGIAIEGSNASVPGDDKFHPNSADSLVYPRTNPYSTRRWFDIFAKGTEGFSFNITADPFVYLSETSGSIWPGSNATDIRIWVSFDWATAQKGTGEARISIASSSRYGTQSSKPSISFPYDNTPVPSSFVAGFVEADGVVSMEAEHFTRTVPSLSGLKYYTIPNYGKTLSGVALTDRNAPPLSHTIGPSLEYDFFTFTDTTMKPAKISLILGQSINMNSHRPLRYAISIDNQPPQNVKYVIDRPKSEKQSGLWAPYGWEKAVSDAAWVSVTKSTFAGGKHTLKFWALEPEVVLQKIVIDLGGMRKSYLGPTESYRVVNNKV